MMYSTLGLLGLGALVCTSCHPTTTASSTTTSAQHYAAGSPEARTVDNAGFVDPGGRTRQVTTGGAVVPSPANAVSPPRREDPIAPVDGDSKSAPVIGPPTAAPSSPSDPIELTQRAARALCDREAYCNRVGDDKTYKSADACLTEKRDRVGRLVTESGCREIRGDRVAACLTAIRGSECGPSNAPLAPPAECAAHALCAR